MPRTEDQDLRRLFSPCRGARTSVTGRKCWHPHRRLPARGRIGRHQRRCSLYVHNSSYTGCWPRRRWRVGWLFGPCVVRPPLWASSRPGREAHCAARPRTRSRRLRTIDAAVSPVESRTCGNSPERHRTCLVGHQSRRQVHQVKRARWIYLVNPSCRPALPAAARGIGMKCAGSAEYSPGTNRLQLAYVFAVMKFEHASASFRGSMSAAKFT